MIRILGLALIVGAASAMGFMFSETLKRRLTQLRELQGALIQLENEIFYTRTALPEACLSVSEKSNYSVDKVFKKVSEVLSDNSTNSVYDAFVTALSCNEEYISLTKEDKDIILDLAKALGESDLEGHKKVFSLAEHRINSKVEELQSGVDKNVKMYRYLGFSLGAAVAIILI